MPPMDVPIQSLTGLNQLSKWQWFDASKDVRLLIILFLTLGLPAFWIVGGPEETKAAVVVWTIRSGLTTLHSLEAGYGEGNLSGSPRWDREYYLGMDGFLGPDMWLVVKLDKNRKPVDADVIERWW